MIGQSAAVAGAESPNGLVSWSPQLDLRNFGLDMVTRALAGLDQVHWEPWFADYMRRLGLGQADLDRTRDSFATALGAFARDPRLVLPQLLDQHGFFAAPLPCQLALMAKIGQAAIGHLQYALGQAIMVPVADETGTVVDHELPYLKALGRLLDEGAKAAQAFAQRPTTAIDRLGLGLRLLRPFAVSVDAHGIRGFSIACDAQDCYVELACTPVPDDVRARVIALGWVRRELARHLGEQGTECYEFCT